MRVRSMRPSSSHDREECKERFLPPSMLAWLQVYHPPCDSWSQGAPLKYSWQMSNASPEGFQHVNGCLDDIPHKSVLFGRSIDVRATEIDKVSSALKILGRISDIHPLARHIAFWLIKHPAEFRESHLCMESLLKYIVAVAMEILFWWGVGQEFVRWVESLENIGESLVTSISARKNTNTFLHRLTSYLATARVTLFERKCFLLATSAPFSWPPPKTS